TSYASPMRPITAKNIRAFVLIFALGGLIMLALAGYMAYLKLQFIQSAVQSRGEVIALEQRQASIGSKKDQVVFSPVVRFRDEAGTEVTFTDGLGQYPAGYAVGERVSVLYPRGNAQQAEINSFGSLWGLPIGFASMGSLFTLIAALAWLFIRYRAARQLRKDALELEWEFPVVAANKVDGSNGA
ncbi:MAG: DUF3592 domain-containing protein, partial [Pseudomonas sp.]